MDQVRERRPLILSWIEIATPLSLENGLLLIGFPTGNELAIESLSRPNNQKFIEDLLTEILSGAAKIEFEQRDNLRPAQLRTVTSQKTDPMEDFRKDPMIRKALEIFKAEIETVES